jgi:hypothetical protein
VSESSPARFRLRTTDLKWREVDGEIVALDAGESVYLGTNRTGTLLWRELSEGATVDQLVEAVVSEFGIDRQRARTDVEAFVGDLQSKGLVEPA